MRLGEDAIKKLIAAIGFTPQDGKSGIYFKSYPAHDGYSIFVDFNSRTITYDSSENPSDATIKVWDRRTSDFSKDENFVVLECVDRLLSKGYVPSCIELEKNYPSGRGHSGQIDILVKTPDGVPFLMFECKTWGPEYEKEKSKMAKNGGQLFTYYVNARATRYLCLYTSRVGKAVEYRSSVVDVEDDWAGLSEVKDIYSHWNKNFKDNGIFDSYAAPYDIKHKALTYGELETLKEEDSGKIYNQIMEILRHNAISDKPNAFNKLLNLFVCKIIDEDKNPDDELAFQWLEGDTDESLQLRLNDLYKEGMWRFLEIDVIDYSQDDVAERLATLDPTTKQWIMEMYTNTRLKKSPNFAFVEVQDERTFALNAKVVREIVELLQVYKFRYAQRHEFLGNFFELLLNTSMKQEAGQYFTPVPITRFILSSLPLQKLVQNRVNARNSQPLPTVIDYACGSGHFLTEYMSQMQAIIDSGAIDLRHASPAVRNQFQAWQGVIKFQWAKDYVYGIDLDNRLVKTTKVSAFFNGDGDANIVWADGLDHFTKSETYRDKLKQAHGQDNGQFDILISNPPYSVDSFKGTVAFGAESFTLYPYLTDNSSEIECLFVERMKQLLKVGGWAAVILPSSILTNSGIHARARDILLKYFKFKAIVELGSGTFMKTGTNTVVLFLERRNDRDHVNIIREVDQFFISKNDVAVAGLENAFSTFVSTVYDGLSLDDYLSIFSDTPTEKAKAHELYLDYKKVYGGASADKAIAVEKDKMRCFLLTHDQEIVLVKAGKGKEEKKFLGYEFSERRGHEGLHWLPGGTKLYDETNPLNPQKVSSYIYYAFLEEKCEVDESLAANIFYGRISGFVEFGTSVFDRVINLGKVTIAQSKSAVQPSRFLLQRLENISSMIRRGKSAKYGKSNIQIIKSGQARGYCQFDFSKSYFVSEDFISDERNLRRGDVLINSTGVGTAGRVTLFDLNGNYVVDSHITIVRPDLEKVIPKYMLYALADVGFKNIEAMANGQSGQIELALDTVRGIKIPLPPLGVQQRIVDEIEEIEEKEQSIQAKIVEVRAEVSAIIERCHRGTTDYIKLGRVAAYSTERVDAQTLDRDTYIGVDNLLPDMAGKRASEFVPSSGTVTAYHPGNILLSNIRPYLKKAWLADNHGGSSGDVLVLVVDEEKAFSEYVFAFVSTDQFFDYEMQNIGSNVKMPRADKRKVLEFQIPLLPMQEQQKVVEEIASKKAGLSKLDAQLNKIKEDKDNVLGKYL